MAEIKDNIRPEPLAQALSERYLAYVLSTITQRALPDARDGLKPVHRRILYGMLRLRLEPGSAPQKSGRVVGDVMCSFRPHGGQASYVALVGLAPGRAARYAVITGQRNCGK